MTDPPQTVQPASHPHPVVLSYGVGVDSTALLIELTSRGTPPDLVQTADTGSERQEFYDYLAQMQDWMDARGIAHQVVRYTPTRFKNWPPYASLATNCLTNATLPSISFNRGACSLKWKKAPQAKALKSWPPAQASWARGEKVIRLIGFDSSPADTRRYLAARNIVEPDCEIQYPLREWQWTRQDCIDRIAAENIPIPRKSACWMCLGSKPEDLDTLGRTELRMIVLMEARAAPRLRSVEGLWRRSTAARPGRMTDYIRAQRLLPEAEIDHLWNDAPTELIRFQAHVADLPIEERPSIENWLERYRAHGDLISV